MTDETVGRAYTPPTEVHELSFEDALGELERIVAELEGGQVALEDMLTRFERAMKLKEHCAAMLEKAEARIRELIDEEGQTDPFEVDDSDAEEA